MSQPIYIQATEGVDDGYVGAVEGALDLIDRGFDADFDYSNVSGWRPSRSDYRGVDAEPDEFSSPEWYGKEALGDSRDGSPRLINQDGDMQVDADRLSWLLSNEPWRETHGDHVDVYITDKDLTGRGSNGEFLNYVLGGADADNNPDSIILSTYRMENSQATNSYTTSTPHSFPEEVMHTVALHEFGHLFGAPDENRPEHTLDRGFEGQAHCANNDIMQPGYSTKTLAELTADRIGTGAVYCGDCATDIAEGIEDF
jgi:hypothetical protein